MSDRLKDRMQTKCDLLVLQEVWTRDLQPIPVKKYYVKEMETRDAAVTSGEGSEVKQATDFMKEGDQT
uniref:Uncharacterized protein n=1 Tax=Arion vulgaris TaxID=1028688 RepID=A0A0B7ATI0_9EUPU